MWVVIYRLQGMGTRTPNRGRQGGAKAARYYTLPCQDEADAHRKAQALVETGIPKLHGGRCAAIASPVWQEELAL